jgi:hypothetical protein
MKSFVNTLALCALSAAANDDWQDTDDETTVYSHYLQTNAQGEFTIVQFGDLMYTNPQDFAETEQLMRDIIRTEEPNFIVITGDTVDPSLNYSFEYYYQQAMAYIESTGIPWMWTGGSEVKELTRD